MMTAFFHDSLNLIAWVLRVLARLLRVAWRPTVSVIASSVAARVTRMLTFLLPIKVILLAGSDGVPSYFDFIIAPDQKQTGIILLAAAAIICYVGTLALEAHIKRRLESGSKDLLAASGVMALVSDQQTQAQGFFARFTQLTASMLFVAAALPVLGILNPVLVACVFGLSSALYVFTAWAASRATPLKRSRLATLVNERLNDYFSILSSISFLTYFLVILCQLLLGTIDNILIAIICIVLLRTMLSTLAAAIKEAVGLSKQADLINALVFPSHPLQLGEGNHQRTLRDLFGRRMRETKVAEELTSFIGSERPQIMWRDPALPGVVEFLIGTGTEKEALGSVAFLVRAFPRRLMRAVDNEDLLFRHIDRKIVWAPPVVHRFYYAEHECLVYDVGTGTNPTNGQWSSAQADYTARIWSFEPPQSLVRIYSSSHRFLHERLTDAFVSRLEIAVDSDDEAAVLERFRAALPTVCIRIGTLPLRLAHPNPNREQAFVAKNGDLYVLGWGGWVLEPVGTTLPPLLPTFKHIEAILAEVQQRDSALSLALSPGDIWLARNCSLLEKTVLRGAMKSGLQQAAQILASLEVVGKDIAALDPAVVAELPEAHEHAEAETTSSG